MTAADVITGDAFEVVPTIAPMPNVFTSPPDASEVGMDLPEWEAFFRECLRLVIDNTDPRGYVVLYMTDRRAKGRWYSKPGMIGEVAEESDFHLIWHKIAVRTHGTSLWRPAYTHLIGLTGKGRPGAATPDVFDTGAKAYPNAADENTLRVAFDFLASQGVTHVVDPFAGMGTTGRAATERGMSSTCIELDPEMADRARAYVAGVAS